MNKKQHYFIFGWLFASFPKNVQIDIACAPIKERTRFYDGMAVKALEQKLGL